MKKKNKKTELKDFFNGNVLEKHSKYLFASFFILVMWFVQVTIARCGEKKVREIKALNHTIKTLQEKYVMREREIYSRRLESNLKKKVDSIGLKPMQEPPIIIKNND